MAKPLKVYWDSCAWLGLLNGEPKRKRELEIVYNNARSGYYELWTSTLSMVEVRRLKVENFSQKPMAEANEIKIKSIFRQPFVKPIPVAVDIAEHARQLFRETAGLGKWQDSVHLASALRWNSEVMHTYDNDDLVHLNLVFTCRNGIKLPICHPDETTDGPLFAKKANG